MFYFVLNVHGTTVPFWLASHRCPFRCVSCKPRRVLGEPCGSQPSRMEIHGHSQWAGQFNVNAPFHIWNLTTIPGEKAMPAATVFTCPSLGEAHVLPTAILLEYLSPLYCWVQVDKLPKETQEEEQVQTRSFWCSSALFQKDGAITMYKSRLE